MDKLLDYEFLVFSIINKYSYNFDKDDLYQVGMMGLVEAFKNYNTSFNTKFSTYAYYYILGEVTKYIRDSSSLKISKDLIKLNKSINKAREVMQQKLGREPSNLEISLFLEIEEEKIEEVQRMSELVRSLDWENEEGEDIYNIVGVENKEMSADILDLKEEIDKLDSKDKKLILERYYNDLTQAETSKKLGISQVQVSRKEAKILEKLKSNLVA